MSCRECGCFTLFKEICESCKRATFVFNELKVESYQAADIKTSAPIDNDSLRAPPQEFKEQSVSSQSSDTAKQVNIEQGASIPFNAKDAQDVEFQTADKVSAVAAKLGINLGELQGIFDMNELSAEIKNATTPDPVDLVACQNCTQKIKRKVRCAYCGHASNNFD